MAKVQIKMAKQRNGDFFFSADVEGDDATIQSAFQLLGRGINSALTPRLEQLPLLSGGETEPAKRRGRPPGSKNKQPKDYAIDTELTKQNGSE